MFAIMDFINTIFYTFIIWNNTTNVIFEYNFPETAIKKINSLANDKFPDDFYFGVATSAYECEGAWNITDKGESVWDYMTHSNLNLISDRSNGDVSSDFYHMYEKDIQLASFIGTTVMRISLSWTRILPDGYDNHISHSGILFYKKVINEMLINNIMPMVSLFDGDMPYRLQQLGGWTNPVMIDIFRDYARVAFTFFGDTVKYWATINDPVKMCRYGYGGMLIPAMNMSGIADYLCGHHVLLAHAEVYKLYHEMFAQEDGKLGILNYYTWFVPERNASELDVAAAERAHKFYNDWLTYPIFSQTGDYPDVMKTGIESNSRLEDFPSSRLPAFSPLQIDRIKGSADFLGVNYYTVIPVEDYSDNAEYMSFDKDAGIRPVNPIHWIGETEIKNAPLALTKLLHRLHNDYSLPELWITGNGYADSGDTMDWGRMAYHYEHLQAILKALKDGVDIEGYLVKSLTDGFEDMDGYKTKFGLFRVDFNDTNRVRHLKLSTVVINDIFEKRTVRPLKEIYNSFTIQLNLLAQWFAGNRRIKVARNK